MHKLKQTMISFMVLVFCLMIPGRIYALNPQPEPPRVYIDGTLLQLEVAPLLEDGRTFLPMRAIFEALGADVQWNGATQTVTAKKGTMTLTMQIGSSTAQKNGSSVILEAPAMISDQRTLVPLRFVGEALGGSVKWEGSSRQILINSAASPDTASGTPDSASDTPDATADTPDTTADAPAAATDTPAADLPLLVKPRLSVTPLPRLKSFITLSDNVRAVTLDNGKIYPLLRLDEITRLRKMTPVRVSLTPQAVIDHYTLAPPTATVDLRKYQTPIRDQQGRNTCVSFALLGNMEARYKRLNPTLYAKIDLSEQFAHHIQKMVALMGDPPATADYRENNYAAWGFGDNSFSAYLFSQQYGVPLESALPYVAGGSYENTNEVGDSPKLDPASTTIAQRIVNDFNLNPASLPSAALQQAGYGITSYVNFPEDKLKDIKYYEAVLSSGYEINFAMGIYSPDPTPDNQIWEPGTHLEGYHAMLIVGYDEPRKVFIVKNSWGYDNPLESGYTLISYDYFTKGYVTEASYITGVEANPAELKHPEQLFLGRWKLDHDGWKGTLDIYRRSELFSTGSLLGQNDRRIGTYYHSDGKAYRVNGTMKGNKIEFYIDFAGKNLEYGELLGKRFTGYLYTRQPDLMSGVLTDTDKNVYGFYATRQNYLDSKPASQNIDYASYLGTWAMDHDGWQGKLEVAKIDPANGNISAATYTDANGKKLAVSGKVYADNKRLIAFKIPFDAASPQWFSGYLHSWEPGILAGVTTWDNSFFGFTARRTGDIVMDFSYIMGPASLSADAQSTTTISLGWQDRSSDETAFQIERKSGSGAFARIATVSAGTTSYSDTGLNAGTAYTYRVRAVNGSILSSYSNEASDTTDSLRIITPEIIVPKIIIPRITPITP